MIISLKSLTLIDVSTFIINSVIILLIDISPFSLSLIDLSFLLVLSFVL